MAPTTDPVDRLIALAVGLAGVAALARISRRGSC